MPKDVRSKDYPLLGIPIIDQVEYGVHDRLHIYPLCVIFYFPWHRHETDQITSDQVNRQSRAVCL